ncbi:CRISPR-associated endoribonuclease Cas6 [Sphingobacterium sp. SRCM116780]|uniref:CRISPR-associated endoribonuclease Cas6 n=1 Tax=Sphingobacterium sp. SRCM116780 TaxID=2907623 RepID=UPI001F44C294|nr:CRISPR-associated endoribonuclease Cas6 [Sphingobacterium sp. SRCM116780]UIR57330.1 CRISPR-associated endoribonuclease Cas6 [Sphingobacterium sp. SRCM116780]
MRLYLKLSGSKDPIPFNYQHLLTSSINNWLGKDNTEHGKTSIYSFSWLQNTTTSKSGIHTKNGSYFFISSYSTELIKKMLSGILKSPTLFYGISIIDVQIVETPQFNSSERFLLSSPILLRKKENGTSKHVTYEDWDFDQLLTENIKNKLKHADLSSEGIRVFFDKNYTSPKTKLINYKGVNNKTTLAPIIIEGSPEQIAFTWLVGLGESTGIGFGALK